MIEPSAGWERISHLFDELIELPPDQRDERLRALRVERPELAAELELLLAADGGSGSVLDRGLDAALASRGGDSASDADSLSGRQAGAYRLGERIGSGGMGTVYEAVRADGFYEQRVAVKVLTAVGSPELLRRFARERAILATLQHPHIARLLDAGSLEDRPYLVMELVEGQSLIAHCDEQQADLPTRLRLFRQVCAAVAFAHRRLVVHRDLKPSNVLVGTSGEVKLLDFGIAALLDAEGTSEATMTSTRRAFTPAYAAPEQVYGRAVTTVTDVYALGALLHELLVGRPPEPPWNTSRETSSHLSTTLTGLSADEAEAVAAARGLDRRGLARRLRGDLEAIVATAVRPEPEQRYASADALADDVERYLEGRPVAARGQDRVYRARRFVRRHRAPLAATALAIAGLLTGLWVALAQAREARSEALRAGALRRFLYLELKRELIEQGPMGPDGPTLGYLLDHGLRHVDRDLAKEPEVAAEVFSIAGETYGMFEGKERAVTALRGALARKSALYAEGDERLRRARLDLAHALIEAGHLPEAGSLLEGLERETRGASDIERYDLMTELGEQRRKAGDLPGAEVADRETLAILSQLGLMQSNRGVDQLHRLATVLYLGGRYGESARLLAEVVTLAREAVPNQVPIAWTRRAFALHRLGDLDAAKTAYDEARSALAAQKSLKDAKWALGYVTCGSGLLLVELGDVEAGEAMLDKDDGTAATADHPWARGFGDPGVPCPALAAWARDDLEGFERALAASPSVLRPATEPDRDLLRAELLLDRGRAAEALPLCNAAVRDRDASTDLQPWRQAEAHLLRGIALCRLGRRAEGLPEVERSAAALRARLPGHRYLRLGPVAPSAS